MTPSPITALITLPRRRSQPELGSLGQTTTSRVGAWRGVNNVSRSWYYEMLSLEIHPIRSKTNKNKTGHKGRTIKWARITRCDHLVHGKMSYYNAVHSSISVGHAFTTIGTCNAYNTNCKPDWWAASGTRLSPGNLGANLRRHLK